MPDNEVYQNAVAKCPKCHEDGGMWLGLFPGEPCITCNTTLVHVDGDPNEPKIENEKCHWAPRLANVITTAGHKEVECWGCPEIPGLLINYLGGGEWGLSHAGSGRGVKTDDCFRVLVHAMEFAEKYCTKIDWTVACDGKTEADEPRRELYEELIFALGAEEDMIETLLESYKDDDAETGERYLGSDG